MEYKDELIIHSETRLCWSDRWRVFVYGKLHISSFTKTENVIGACDKTELTICPSYPVRLWWNTRKGRGQAEVVNRVV